MTTIIAKTVAKAVIPIILLVSFALVLQGHNLPGGGFIGGVLTAVAFGLGYIVFSTEYFEKKVARNTSGMSELDLRSSMQQNYSNLFTAGLLVAVSTGLTAVFFDLPFLSQDFWIVHLPIYSELHVASAFMFDLGVYFVVVGSLATVISAVGQE
jgi:multicomponent Na+:H+ antiporter subunit B